MKFMNVKKLTAAVVVSTMLVAGSANAAIDVSGATSSITEGLAAVGVIGAAFIVLTVLKRVWSKIGG